MAESGPFERRAFLALTLAGVAGVVAAFVAAAAVEREPYDDGIELFLPTTLAFVATAAVVLLGFVVMELRRRGRAAAVRLSAAARGLAGLVLIGGSLLLAAFGMPLFFAVPSAALGALALWAAAALLQLPTRHENPTSLISHSGVQSPPGGEG